MKRLPALILVAALSSCPAPAPKCGVGSCEGCCDPGGQCLTGNSNAACGASGAACQPCANTQACTFGQCVAQNLTGGGGGATGGGGGGASAGGGGTGGGAADAGTDAGVCGACRYGELCELDGGAAVCSSDYDARLRPYCDACTSGVQSPCGPGPNFCLLSGSVTACGVDCSLGQACPRGYACQDIAVVTAQSCSAGSPCPANPSLPCATAADCRNGAACEGNFCAPPCLGSFCGCLVDADCLQQTCAGGNCSITNGACVTEADCRPLTCVPSGGAGRCLIGNNCAPAPGLTCADVR